MREPFDGSSDASYKNASSTFHSIVLLTALLLTETIPSEYYSLLFFVTWLLYSYLFRARLDYHAARILRPLVFMVMCGIVYSFSNDRYDSVKDLWYAGKTLLCFLLGFHIARKITDVNRFFNFFVWLSFILCMVFLIKISLISGDVSIENVSGVGGLSLMSVITVPLFFFRKFGFRFLGKYIFKWMIILAVAFTFVFSLSRTMLGSFIILILAGAGFFDNGKKWPVYLFGLMAVLLLVISFLPNLDSQNYTFLGKLNNSLSELSFTDDSDSQAMLMNWRGFEAYRAYVSFINSNVLQQFFGRGLGATVDLGLTIEMAQDMKYQYLPILHNGYLHILTKYGIVGVILYIVYLWRVVIYSKNYFIKKNNLPYARIITGLGMVIAYATLVITGILNKSGLDSTVIIMGFLFGSVSVASQNAR